MTVKLKFASGKEIELTPDEYQELMGKIFFTPQIQPIPVVPYYPPITLPYLPPIVRPFQPWDGTITVTCKSEGATLL